MVVDERKGKQRDIVFDEGGCEISMAGQRQRDTFLTEDLGSTGHWYLIFSRSSTTIWVLLVVNYS